MESQGHGQVAFDAAFEAKHPRNKAGEFTEKGTGEATAAEEGVKDATPMRDAGEAVERATSVKKLPDNWGTLKTTERRELIASGLNIPLEGTKDITIGDLPEVKLGRSAIRHSLKEYRSLLKDALMMSPDALLAVFRDAHYEKDEPNTKEHVDRTMRYKSTCVVDGREYVVGFIVHHNFKDGQYHLYHISVYDK